jgi:FMN reductase
MPHKKLVLISGSPSASSRSHRVLDALASRLEASNTSTRLYSLRDFEAGPLLHADTTNSNIRRFIEEVVASDGIVVATPVYKGTFAGALKILLDVIPPDALLNKVALGIATARISSHLDGVAAGLSGVFDFFRVRVQVAPLLLTDDGLFDAESADKLSQATVAALTDAAKRLTSLLDLPANR